MSDSMHVLVLMGGDSPEREISLASGAAVAKALGEAGHRAEAVDIPRVAAVVDLPALGEADVVFPALHGGQGEDGHLQAVLDVLGVRYALSGPLASALAMDKSATKRVMRAAGIPTPTWLQVTWNHAAAAAATGGQDGLTVDRILERATVELGFPLVVKLNGAGSSVGVEIVEHPAGFPEAFARVAAAGEGGQVDVLLEKFIPGRELTATILLGRRLPLLEIRPRQGFYDYQNKYTAGASDYLVPAPVHSPLYEQISADALRLYELVGCSGVARVDFRLDGESYNCLEINTIPGMTDTSLVPMAAEAVGIAFTELVEDLCRRALEAS
ncbi:MAG: D-alanine--D-alanine ligase [bacterium]|nr:D-alanine--D-alanine ligase [bacterium]